MFDYQLIEVFFIKKYSQLMRHTNARPVEKRQFP